MPTPTPRCSVYIDGYNFYYGLLKEHPEWKWLNLERFFVDLRPLEEVTIKYFTAMVTGESGQRQALYLRALGTLSSVKIIKGKFQIKPVRCLARCGEEYPLAREKKTDVNIAVSMIDDCLNDACDSMVLVSGDSDLEPAVQWVHRRKPELPITVYLPKLPTTDPAERRNDFYKSIGVDCYMLPILRLPTFQFGLTVKVAEKQWVQRPAEWTAVVNSN